MNYYNANYDTAFKDLSGNTVNKKPMFTNSITKTINGQTKNVKYYSGIDAEIYFEDVYIDEVVQIQFSVQQNVMPIVGYNSYVYDDVALGSRLVQGQFVINFTRAEYLIEVLNKLSSKSIIRNSTIISEDELQYQAKLEQIRSDANLVDKTLDPIEQWQRSPLWKKNFNIVMSYGGYLDNNAGGTLLVLNGVQINSCTQGLAATGEPVTEIYSFIARDIQFVPSSTNEEFTQVAASTVPDASNNYNIKVLSANYSEEVTNVNTQSSDNTITNKKHIDREEKEDQTSNYNTLTTNAYLTSEFDFNNYSVQSITAYLSIQVSNIDSSKLSVPLDIKSIDSNNTIKTQLDSDVISYVDSYESVTSSSSLSRPFNVSYTIVFKDSDGNTNKVIIQTSVSLSK